MAITCEELMASRSGTKGESIDLVYVVRNTADYDAVVAAVEATAPASFSGLFRQNPKVVPEFVDTAQPDTGLWKVTVPYRSPSYTKLQSTVPVGSRRIDIDTTGGTRHITQGVGPSNGVVWRFPAEIDDLDGAIGDDGNGKVAGVDIAAPACHLTVTDVRSSVTTTYLRTCFNRQDCVNDATLILSDDKRSFSFAAGEALYLGYTMRDRDDGVELVHQFDCMPNQVSDTIGGIVVPEKKAFDYLWFQYQLQTDGSRYFTAPVAAFINQVYLEKDLSLLGLGT